MTKFKVGDKVKIIKRCDCSYARNCKSCNGNKSGIIKNYQNNEYIVGDIKTDEGNTQCHFKESQLELIIAEVKQYGIVAFCEKYYK